MLFVVFEFCLNICDYVLKMCSAIQVITYSTTDFHAKLRFVGLQRYILMSLKFSRRADVQVTVIVQFPHIEERVIIRPRDVVVSRLRFYCDSIYLLFIWC